MPCYILRMHPVYRLLITLLLAMSLPMQGMAAAWQTCCDESRPPTTAHTEEITPPVHVHGGHDRREAHSHLPANTPDAHASQSSTTPHACAHTADCCTVALLTPHLTAWMPALPKSSWLPFQPSAPDSHTPPTLDPPPRIARS